MILQLLSWRVRNIFMHAWKVTKRSTVNQEVEGNTKYLWSKVSLWVNPDKTQELLIHLKCHYSDTVLSILMLYLAEKLRIHMRFYFWLFAARRLLNMCQSSGYQCKSQKMQQRHVMWSKGGTPLRSDADCYSYMLIHEEKHVLPTLLVRMAFLLEDFSPPDLHATMGCQENVGQNAKLLPNKSSFSFAGSWRHCLAETLQEIWY